MVLVGSSRTGRLQRWQFTRAFWLWTCVKNALFLRAIALPVAEVRAGFGNLDSRLSRFSA
jgi:hypothetical protein